MDVGISMFILSDNLYGGKSEVCTIAAAGTMVVVGKTKESEDALNDDSSVTYEIWNKKWKWN